MARDEIDEFVGDYGIALAFDDAALFGFFCLMHVEHMNNPVLSALVETHACTHNLSPSTN
ncbi:hypothetical protein ACPOL_1398 [Acidisarcina polymorpha]|uniref:Uncharacterized protein n=1 Tax=Acidisarcina polymorpha TaxID=2211140 RepID=A0A2Z5FWF2_9BACT|nr:hypothetical protein [Acidisarcina polymorpha]AXC10746.1 hypothetical protein ACPOL_1398 [Acidisarcina polymorpha]